MKPDCLSSSNWVCSQPVLRAFLFPFGCVHCSQLLHPDLTVFLLQPGFGSHIRPLLFFHLGEFTLYQSSLGVYTTKPFTTSLPDLTVFRLQLGYVQSVLTAFLFPFGCVHSSLFASKTDMTYFFLPSVFMSDLTNFLLQLGCFHVVSHVVSRIYEAET